MRARTLAAVVALGLASSVVPLAGASASAGAPAAGAGADPAAGSPGAATAEIDPALLAVDGPITVAVSFTASPPTAGSRAATARVKAAALAASTVLQDWPDLPAALVRVPDQRALDALAHTPGVARLDADVAYVLVDGSTSAGGATGGPGGATPPSPWQSDPEALALIRQPQAAAAGYKGAGTAVAVLDTGVDLTQPIFGTCPKAGAPGCRVVSLTEVAPPDGAQDDVGHGSNVTGIVASVAPATKIAVYDIFTETAEGPRAAWSDIATAVQLVLDRKAAGFPVVSVNLSLGDRTYHTEPTTGPLTAPFQALRAHGVAPVVASGNERSDSGLPVDGIGYPAADPYAFAVGAVYDANLGSHYANCLDLTTKADMLTCFSQTSDQVAVLAPGADIDAGGRPGYAGTSMAAPHVAAALAVVRGAAPGASLDKLLGAVRTSPVRVVDPEGRSVPRVDLPSAVAAAKTVRDTTAPVVAPPGVVPQLGAKVRPTAITMDVRQWADDPSGVRRLELFRQKAGTTWPSVGVVNGAAGTIALTASPGRFHVASQATDTAGNRSPWRTNDVWIGLRQDVGTGIRYAGPWHRAARSGASDGMVMTSASSDARATIWFTGRTVSIVGTTGPYAPTIELVSGGLPLTSASLWSDTIASGRVVLTYSFPTAGAHVVTVRPVVGAGVRPGAAATARDSFEQPLDIDAVIVL